MKTNTVLGFPAATVRLADAAATASSSAAQPSASANPWYDPATIGTFELNGLEVTPAMVAFRNRHQEETLAGNRTVQIRHGGYVRKLTQGKPLDVEVTVNGSLHTTQSYMYNAGMAGLIVVQDGVIRIEEYQYGNLPSSLNVIQSCTKTFTTTALGIALAEGLIGSIDDKAEKYIPELSGTDFGKITLRSLSDMTSGMDVPADEAGLFAVYGSSDPDAALRLIASYKKRAEPGETYMYSNFNYYVLSVCIQRAVEVPIEEFITEKIWAPAGMQYDGFMRRTGAGQVDGHGGLAIALADMARYGMFILDSYHGTGGPNLPSNWFEDIAHATTSATGFRSPDGSPEISSAAPNMGYQTGWWTQPRNGSEYQLGDDLGFAAHGTYASTIFVVPGLNLIIATQANYPVHFGDLFFWVQQYATGVAQAIREESL